MHDLQVREYLYLYVVSRGPEIRLPIYYNWMSCSYMLWSRVSNFLWSFYGHCPF